ncbi:putative protein with domain found in Dishevelled, Egl-10, and Pleckstrin (DEP) [Lyophyllum shimeji]|uniref:Uncharacterized protein n=1 Tax=Lyophyllum shimeji TaxID=47721 RepID=A0A9P3PVB3_LYOSH|nr:putative protein with domain found in Dishevelled, Egl-10, and Pleckstrin (DEP) [Lyophyllum shimeji]
MAVLSLPLTFTNSFWSQDYRRGLEVLFNKLEQGVAENAEIVAFIRARAVAEGHLAISLTNPGMTGPAGTGFSADDGASLLMAFRGLQAESVAQGQAHRTIAKELDTLVADPFEEWARAYGERIRQNKATVLDNWLRSYEQAHNEVSKLKQQYLAKTRRADDAEDDAKFAPNSGGNVPDKYTTSPRVRPVDGRPTRTASVSERISQRLKEIQKKSAGALHSTLADGEETEEKPAPKVDKGKGKAVDQDAEPPVTASPPPMSPALPPRAELPAEPAAPVAPAPILLAGLALPPAAVSQLLTRAAAELPLRPVRFPLLGEYQDCFNGEEFVSWLNANVPGFGGNLDRAEDAARDLTEREGLLRRLGELGNQFEHSDDAFYQFRPKAFELEKHTEQNGATPSASRNSLQSENLIKKTGNFVNLVSKVLNNAGNSEPAYVRARHEADEADHAYRIAVRKLDRQRLALEERIEETLKTLQRWEIERLRAVKTVLLQYQGTLANLPKSLEPSIERQATLVASYQPENDLHALIERYRTGPFRPDAQVYESIAHDESDVVFGIDLRKWAEGGWHALTTGEEKKELIPPVITALLEGLTQAYGRLPNDEEKRKSWIYEVPLSAVHHLREALNAVPPEQPILPELVAKYDSPVIASAIKLWILELDPPLALYEGWDDLRKLYPTVGSSAMKAEGEKSPEEHIQSLGAALQRLPRVHLYVLDAIVKHLKTLIDTTTVDESNEVYITKLALSVGRTIVRPKIESELSIQDRHPTLLFIDLLKNYDAILPPTISRKKRESERKVPIRKRTAPIDMRLSRSRISVGADAKQLLAAQQIAQNPSLVKSPKSPELPPLPSQVAVVSPPPPPPPVAQSTAPAASPVVPPPPPPTAVVPPPPPPAVVPSSPPPALVPPPPPSAQATQAPPPPPPSMPPRTDRPTFKEPPPEVEGQPRRPTFKEPPPELDVDTPPSTRPTFVDPPAAAPEAPTPRRVSPKIPSPPTTAVIPPTPQKRTSVGSGIASPAASPSPTKKIGSRSPSPPEDQPIAPGRSSLTRAGSAQSGGVRGPRVARGPRAGGNVSSMVQNLNNKNSVSGSPPQSSPISPATKSLNRLSGSPVRRPSSVLGRSAAFSRRTMASDAEDDIVERK